MKTLKQLLLKKGSFPPEERTLIWNYLLGLPKNDAAFYALVDCGTEGFAATSVGAGRRYFNRGI